MGKTITEEMLKKMTKEEREELVKHLISPIRCGGLDYIDGKPFYRIGGKLIPKDEMENWKKLRQERIWKENEKC